MDADQITAAGGVIVGGLGVLAAIITTFNARLAAEATARAVKAAAQIGRDQNREAEFRERRIEAFRQLARSCASAVEALDRWGEIGLALAGRQHAFRSMHVAKRRIEQAQHDREVEGDKANARATWDAMPSDQSLRSLLLDVELVGPDEVIEPARAYVQQILAVKHEAEDSGLYSGLAAGTLTGLEPRREAMYVAMRDATGDSAGDPSAFE